jgi:lipoyl(octanoyl) transferase
MDMEKQKVYFQDWGLADYGQAWERQESLLNENVDIKTQARLNGHGADPLLLSTKHHLIFCEHSPVYTLGKSGKKENVLLTGEQLAEKEISFYHTNRGGDITFHGLQQLVAYPILDLEKMYTDIGKYLRNLEEVVIMTLSHYGIKGERSEGETGVWIDPLIPGKERKICAIGVRCSRWITMHGLALNVNTDLSYFNNIIPCGIVDKQVTSIEKEKGEKINMDEVKQLMKSNFEEVFDVQLI